MRAGVVILLIVGAAGLGLAAWQVLREEATPPPKDGGSEPRIADGPARDGGVGGGSDGARERGPTAPTPPGDGASVLLVSGRVTRLAGGPLPGARITALAPGTARPRSTSGGDDGRFRLEGPPAPELRVVVTAAGHAARRFEGLRPGAVLDVALRPTVAFAGTVARAGAGPVDRAAVELRPRHRIDLETYRTETDARGRFRFEAVCPGVWDVSITGRDLAPHHETGLVIPESGDFTKDFVLFGGLPLVGTVMRRSDRALIRGAVVMVQDRIQGGTPLADQSRLLGPFTTDDAGRFVVTGLPPGRVQVWVRARGFQCAITHKDLLGTAAADLSIEVLLDEAIPIRGLVVGEDELPVPEARIIFRPQGEGDMERATELAAFLVEAETWRDGVLARWPAVHADRAGRFTLDGVPAWARFDLEARDREERLAPSEVVSVSLAKRTEPLDVVLRLRAPRRLSGTVVGEDGAPLAEVVLTLGTSRVRTGAAGRFELLVPADARGTLSAVLAGWLPATFELDLAAGEDLPETLRLERGDRLLGRVLDRAARPVIGARVDVRAAAAGSASIPGIVLAATTTDLEGGFVLGGFRADRVRLTVDHPAFRPATLEPLSPGPSPVTVRLDARVLEGTGDVMGQVLDATNGVPLEEFSVPGIPPERLLRFQGHFVLQNLEPGRHDLRFLAPGRQAHVVRDVDVRPGALTRLEPVRLHPGQPLVVAVWDERMRPFTGPLSPSIEELDGQGNPEGALELRRPGDRGAQWALAALRPGRYRLTVRGEGVQELRKEFAVGAGPASLTIQLARRR